MQHQRPSRQRPRVRTVTAAAFLAAATVGATIAGLTAANADEHSPGFEIISRPNDIHDQDRTVLGVGWASTEHVASGLAEVGLRDSCNDIGFRDLINVTHDGAEVEESRWAVFTRGECSTPVLPLS